MKHRFWFIKWPGSPYAWGPQDFGTPINEREVRCRILEQDRLCQKAERSFVGRSYKRLPTGFQCRPQ